MLIKICGLSTPKTLEAAVDAGVDVVLVDHVLIDVGGRAHLLDEEAAARATPLSRPATVGAVVAAPEDVREQAFVDLGGGFDEVARRRRQAAPTIDALDGVDPAGGNLAAVIEERPSWNPPRPSACRGSPTMK